MKIKLYQDSFIENRSNSNTPIFRMSTTHLVMYKKFKENYIQLLYIHFPFGMLGILSKSYYWRQK